MKKHILDLFVDAKDAGHVQPLQALRHVMGYLLTPDMRIKYRETFVQLGMYPLIVDGLLASFIGLNTPAATAIIFEYLAAE